MVDFVQQDLVGIIIITNKVVSALDLQMIENYVKSADCINANDIESSRLPQSKSYLKIIGIPYLQENLVSPITSSVVEDIKKNYIFNNIVLALKPRIIKVFPKSNMTIIWVNIWDIQSSSKVKSLINRCFNVGSYIVTICQVWFTLGWKSAEWTCGMTLASAYVLYHLSATWSQLQIMGRSPRWE